MLGLVSLALAHVPHQQVNALAPTPELDGSAPWFALVQPYATALMRSDDAGRTWYHHGGPPAGDSPLGLARTSDGVVAVLGSSRYWWSSDDGLTWASEPHPGSVIQIGSAGPEFLLVGESGIWAFRPGEVPARESEAPSWRLGRGVLPTAIDTGGIASVRVAREWLALPALGEGITATAAAGNAVFAGTMSGATWRWDGSTWTQCGTIPGDGDYDAVVALAIHGTTLLAGTGLGAPHATAIDCAAWTDRTAPEQTQYASDGGASSVFESVTALATHSARVAWAGWTGIWTIDHGRWHHAPALAADFTRGVAIDHDERGGLRLLVGSYGAGVLRSADGGLTWAAPSHGLGESNIQDVVAFPSDTQRVLTLANHSLFVSGDGGQHFDATSVDGLTQNLALEQGAPGVAWAHAESGLWRTGDEGRTWSSRPDVPTGAGGSLASAVRTTTATCVAMARPTTVTCTEPGDDDWSTAVAIDERAAVAMVGWPAGSPTRLLLFSGTAVRRSDDDFASETRTTLLEADSFAAAAVADDGTVVAATAGGSMLTSRDGGETWTTLAVRVPAPVTGLAPHPGFANSPVVLVGSYDGPWLLSRLEAGGQLDAFAPRHRIDDASEFLAATRCAPATTDARGDLDSLTALSPGCTLRGWLRAESLAVRAAGTGVATLAIDGREPIPFDGGGDEVIEALSVDLDGGWHEVEIVGVDGAVMLDSIEGSWPGATLEAVEVVDTGDTATDSGGPGQPPPGEEPCGCEGGNTAALIPLALLAVRRYRPKPRGDR
ncbi:MAG: exo-alpha-sialidase [Deltaproteobacteria bacterium]|nr:exo-alpha-sialidase [Deltaproteobacteria bacterium]